MTIKERYLREAGFALGTIRKGIRWKPGKDAYHLEKRKTMGHLPPNSSLEDYNALISKLVWNDNNIVYLYKFDFKIYYVVSGEVQNVDWIVIFSKNGLLETAFPPYDVEDYIRKRGFVSIGKIKEILE